MTRTLLLLVAASFFFISGCKKNKQKELDEEIIQAYILENNLTTTKTESGLHYVITAEGSGGFPSSNAYVTVDYVGKFLDGEIFDQNDGIKGELSRFIIGWAEGIQKLKKGGAGTLIIPSHLAYGAEGAGSIPPNEVLVFDVELIDFQN